ILASLLASALTACATGPAPVASTPAPAAAASPAPLADLVKAVDIPYEQFTLANGLTTIVHTDRKAPIVGTMIYYRVGSKHEPKGRTGFAHLYEHLFFGGSENVPNFDIPLESAGSTGTNGTTWYDRTNYFQTVPTGALDLALFMESDRMGHLLGAVTQDKLDKQRGVVQNEKRQGDNQPYALAEGYAIAEGLFPVGHPYRHSTIGSMADLDAATLTDVRRWFSDHYGPNNAVLVLTGDIDAATARPMVEKWFGAIPRGPDVKAVAAEPVTLPAPAVRDMADQVPVLRLTRNWSSPGVNHPDAPALEIGIRILGGLASSRLDNALVRGDQLAVAVTASAQTLEQVSFLQATMDVKPGTDRARAEAAFDALIARYIAEGPDEDEVRRAATRTVSEEIGALEMIGGMTGKGATLAEGQLYSGDPAQFKADLARIAALTPADVRAAMQRWLTRPTLAINVVPGQRTEKGETMGGWGDEAGSPPPPADPRKPVAPLAKGSERTAPPVAPVGDLAFPVIERARLANGIPVALARRTAVPKVVVSLQFDGGIAADLRNGPGTQALMLDMLDEGTDTRNATAIAEEQERLGASLQVGTTLDRSSITLGALAANLGPSLALMADVVRHPAFAPTEVARVKDQQLAELSQALANPAALARRTLARELYGPAHPYGQPADGLGDAASLSAMTPEALRAAHTAWMRPELARVTVVGDIAMDRLLPLLEQAFGAWKASASSPVAIDLAAPVPAPRSRIVLIDRPNSPQSVITAGRVLPITGRTPDAEALDLANEVLGGGFLSRLNTNLREDKGWSYGVFSNVASPAGPRSLMISAPVQADRTGDSIRLILDEMRAFPAQRSIDAAELARVTDGNIRGLPNRFETNAQVLRAVTQNELLGRPDDYYATVAGRWRALDATALDNAARTWLQPDGLTFVVVGDRRVVEPQLRKLGLPLELRPDPTKAD
ncbi:MAG: pitrilysin family protein, partial [Novosphingobium sp.]